MVGLRGTAFPLPPNFEFLLASDEIVVPIRDKLTRLDLPLVLGKTGLGFAILQTSGALVPWGTMAPVYMLPVKNGISVQKSV